MTILCYTYNADYHCEKCTMEYARSVPVNAYNYQDYDLEKISKKGLIDLTQAIEYEMIPDSEDNPIRAMLDTEEWYANEMYEDEPMAILVCGTCGEVIEKKVLRD